MKEPLRIGLLTLEDWTNCPNPRDMPGFHELLLCAFECHEKVRLVQERQIASCNEHRKKSLDTLTKA